MAARKRFNVYHGNKREYFNSVSEAKAFLRKHREDYRASTYDGYKVIEIYCGLTSYGTYTFYGTELVQLKVGKR